MNEQMNKQTEETYRKATPGFDWGDSAEKVDEWAKARGDSNPVRGILRASVPASPLATAEQIIKADQAHRSLAADQALLLKMVMPFIRVGLYQLQDGIAKWCKHQGFWGEEVPYAGGTDYMKKAEKIALMHTELSELLEGLRNNDPANEAEECADVAIRLLDYCGHYEIDLAFAIERKMLKNYQRPSKHGKLF